ncbi:MAG: 16S rRNA (cytidine(1402)-2'-O)-methyltransferase [Clostridiales bacterium]|nr:16S rRNA (cytidine(1402)-2'-O)-methyltransferase [Clostridiales bacterium]
MEAGKLYICATPIGNMEDITLRVLRTLKEVDYIAAEDTRYTLKLLNHYGISKPLVSYHQHNQQKRGEYIIELLEQGYNIAVVSDSGMPGISDPGAQLVVLARDKGIPVTVVPGPTACVSALVLSGMDTDRFVFEGFLPKSKKARNRRLEQLKEEERTIVLYEAPHRLISTLEALLENLGDRKIAVVRELTKIYEEVLVMNLEEMLLYFREHPPKGEIVLVIEGFQGYDSESKVWDVSIEEQVRQYIDSGLAKKEAIKRVARERGLPKNQVYKLMIED